MTKPSNLRDAAEVAVTEADQSAAEAWLNANNGEWIDALNLAEAFARYRAAVEAENERLNSLINDTAKHWLDLQHDHPIAWEGAVDAAMEAACDEIRRLSAALGDT